MDRRHTRRSGNTGAENTDTSENTANTSTGREELVTGVPIEDGVPEGSPQYAVYEAEERKRSAEALANASVPPIEQRDNRGDAMSDKDIPIHKVDEMTEEAVREIAPTAERIQAERQGRTLVVTSTTRHGTSRATADVDDWSEGSVRKALKSITRQMTGDETPAGTEPKDKLAESVREVAKGG